MLQSSGGEGRLGMGELRTVLQWWVTAGNPWIFLALERNTSGGRSIKAAGCPGPSASFLNARGMPKEALRMEASPHTMELGHRVLQGLCVECGANLDE